MVLESLLSLLKRHSISAVADVRSHPYSRLCPHFSRQNIANSLAQVGVRYVFLGKELGARVSDPFCYENGKVLYDRVASTEKFRNGIERILRGISEYRVALLCAEKEPLACHRAILIARHLRERNVAVKHILHDGNLENHEDSLARLVRILGMPESDMFNTKDEIISQAYAAQAQRIAFTKAEEQSA